MKQTHTQTHESTTCKLTVLFYTSASFRLHDRREKLDAQVPAGFTDLASGWGPRLRGKKNTNQSCVGLPLAACVTHWRWSGVALRCDLTTRFCPAAAAVRTAYMDQGSCAHDLLLLFDSTRLDSARYTRDTLHRALLN